MNIWNSSVTISESLFVRVDPPLGGGIAIQYSESVIEKSSFQQCQLSECITINTGEGRLSELLFIDNQAKIALVSVSHAVMRMENITMTQNHVSGVVGSLIWTQNGANVEATGINATYNSAVVGGACAFTLTSEVVLSSSYFAYVVSSNFLEGSS